jgi:hypothetical protein
MLLIKQKKLRLFLKQFVKTMFFIQQSNLKDIISHRQKQARQSKFSIKTMK